MLFWQPADGPCGWLLELDSRGKRPFFYLPAMTTRGQLPVGSLYYWSDFRNSLEGVLLSIQRSLDGLIGSYFIAVIMSVILVYLRTWRSEGIPAMDQSAAVDLVSCQ